MLSTKQLGLAICCAGLGLTTYAQSSTDIAALKGLAPVTVLSKSDAGKAALAANYVVTGGIQTGTVRQTLLLPFEEQQQQALRDVFMTTGNLTELSDGLGSSLGGAYIARAHYIDRSHFSNISQNVADVIRYAYITSSNNSGSGKYAFANETTNGKTPVSVAAKSIFHENGGLPDIFGKAYGLPAGSVGGDAYGNSRPFQTEKSFTHIVGRDYFSVPADNEVENRGPAMNLTDSPSYPSGHTTYGYTGALLLALLVPNRYPQMIVRGAEYGNDRIIVGAHYAMDVLGGRTLALFDMAHLLANDPAYIGQTLKETSPIADFRAVVIKAREDVTKVLEAGCGKPVASCAQEDTSRFSDEAIDASFYASTQTYGLPVVYPENANRYEDVAKLAPEAGYLLTVAFPSLTLERADNILTETEGPGGGFLDNGSSFGVYSRLNLYTASLRAKQLMTR